MRYALRNQDKIATAFSDDYLKQHLLASLDKFFKSTEDSVIEERWVEDDECGYKILRINDIADNDSILEFAIVGKQYDVLKLAFKGRIKG